MNAAEREVTEIQSKLTTVNDTIAKLNQEILDLPDRAELGLQLFGKPEDDPSHLLEKAREQRDVLQTRLKELEPNSVILLEAKWEALTAAADDAEAKSVKSLNYEYYQQAAQRAEEEADAIERRIGELRATDLGAGIGAEADRLTAEIARLEKVVDELDDLDTDATPEQDQQLAQARKDLHDARHLAAELRPYSVTLLDAEAARLQKRIAEESRQDGTLPSVWSHLQRELDEVYAQRHTLLDTGHYDDGHSFGWTRPDSGSNRRALKVAAAAIAAVAALIAGAFALANRGDGGTTQRAAADAPSSSSSSSSSTASPTGAAPSPPPNVVLASCLQLDVRPGGTTMIETFITAPMVPGNYTVTLGTAGGDKIGSGAVAEGASFAAIPVEFTQFTTINGITIDGPNGPIDPGTFGAQFPFELNAANDHPTDCDGSKLTVPTPPAASSPTLEAEVGTFLDELARNTRSGNVSELLRTLNQAVLDRYGTEGCRTFLQTTTDATAAFTVVEVGKAGPFEYTSDGQTTTVTDALPVTVQHTQNGQTANQTIHVARDSNGALTWFTRCRAG